MAVRLYNARGVGARLDLTSERARQLIRSGKIPTAALLNGKTPLVDEHTLETIAREREQRRASAA